MDTDFGELSFHQAGSVSTAGSSPPAKQTAVCQPEEELCVMGCLFLPISVMPNKKERVSKQAQSCPYLCFL